MDTSIPTSTSQYMMANSNAGLFNIMLCIHKKILFLTCLLPGWVQKGRVWWMQMGGRARVSSSQRGASSTLTGAVRPNGGEACSRGLTHSPSRDPIDPRCRVQPPTEGEKFIPGATRPGQLLSSPQNEGGMCPITQHDSQVSAAFWWVLLSH